MEAVRGEKILRCRGSKVQSNASLRIDIVYISLLQQQNSRDKMNCISQTFLIAVVPLSAHIVTRNVENYKKYHFHVNVLWFINFCCIFVLEIRGSLYTLSNSLLEAIWTQNLLLGDCESWQAMPHGYHQYLCPYEFDILAWMSP